MNVDIGDIDASSRWMKLNEASFHILQQPEEEKIWRKENDALQKCQCHSIV